MAGSVIVSGARTPMGRLAGSLGSFRATDLGGFAIAAALERAGVSGDEVDYVYLGQVVQAGAGQVPARRAAVNGGISMSVPSNALNKACLSGINAIHLADQMIQAGEADVVVAGGMESMSSAPYLLPGARDGLRYGDATAHDALIHDGLFCAFDHCLMGAGTDRYAATADMAREPQDAYAARSHERAARAQKDGVLADEIVPVTVPQRRGDPIEVVDDEGIRPGTSAEALSRLAPAFSESGNITAGNASQLSDGACAVVVASPQAAERLGVEPLGEIVSYGQVAGPDTNLLHQPSAAALQALDRAGLSVGDVELFEINEAFAAVALASIEDLGVPDDIVNVNGGAIALGHPIGMSGARLVLTLALELGRRGGGVGSASLCGGGGQGDALLLRV
ncbi:MAG: acetyl-CoA C-acetyltransferase [Acidimicrobiia bacterium]|nr:acetyl-CoA C-acetyltransferase [Acidimicrobiia bacterium]